LGEAKVTGDRAGFWVMRTEIVRSAQKLGEMKTYFWVNDGRTAIAVSAKGIHCLKYDQKTPEGGFSDSLFRQP
jgi:hypothetical protein